MRLAQCSQCGFCKSTCPTFKALLEETPSARGRALLLKKDVLDDIYYLCSLCGACKVTCPVGIDLPEEIRLARERMVEKREETEANRIMIKNIRECGNPYGTVKDGKKPKGLYCC